MMPRKLWKSALAAIATAGTVLAPAAFATDAPQPVKVKGVPASRATSEAASPESQSPTAKIVSSDAGATAIPMKQVIQDVSLDAAGALSGTFVDDQGKPVGNEAVTIRQGKVVVTATKTDAAGKFRASGLKTGMYELASASGSRVFRVWKKGTAPKNARSQALIVTNRKLVRGQTLDPAFDLLTTLQPGTLTGVGFGIAGTTIGIISIEEANDANDRADRAEALVQSLTQ